MLKDLTPTKENISLHGLGFIQVKLGSNQRLHVWHPDLPRRSCYAHSAIHNHRFAFISKVLIGAQVNQRYTMLRSPAGSHDLISHDGPRSEKGGRLSFVDGRATFTPLPPEIIMAGTAYTMSALEFHETPNSHIVITAMHKLAEGDTHAHSAILHGHTFDQSFDRFQLSEDRLWQFVVDAFREGVR